MKSRFIIAKILKRGLNPPALRNCHKHKTAKVCSGSELTKVTIGKYSYIGNRCFVVNASIGNFCSIADRCSIGGAMHPLERVSTSPVFHEGRNIMRKNFIKFPRVSSEETIIGHDVWLGMGVFVKSGVSIGNGAVIGMGSVVTHDVPAYEIWAGNPAKKIGMRFSEKIANAIEETNWYNFEDSEIDVYAKTFDNPERFLQLFNEKNGGK